MEPEIQPDDDEGGSPLRGLGVQRPLMQGSLLERLEEQAALIATLTDRLDRADARAQQHEHEQQFLQQQNTHQAEELQRLRQQQGALQGQQGAPLAQIPGTHNPTPENLVEAVVKGMRESNLGNARPKVPRPDLFNGEGQVEVDDWLFRVEQYFEVTRTPPDTKIGFTASLLRGAAAHWWRAQRERDGLSDVCTNWNAFKRTLATQFRPMLSATKAREALYSSQSRNYTSIVEFNKFFRAQCLRVDTMTEEEKVFLYTRKLQDPLKSEVASKEPTDLDTCMRLAEAISAIRRDWTPGKRTPYFKTKKRRGSSSYPFTFGTHGGASSGTASAPASDPMDLDVVLGGARGRWGRGRGRGRWGGRGRGIQCFGCHGYGHTKAHCPQKKRAQRAEVNLLSASEPTTEMSVMESKPSEKLAGQTEISNDVTHSETVGTGASSDTQVPNDPFLQSILDSYAGDTDWEEELAVLAFPEAGPVDSQTPLTPTFVADVEDVKPSTEKATKKQRLVKLKDMDQQTSGAGSDNASEADEKANNTQGDISGTRSRRPRLRSVVVKPSDEEN